MAEYKKLEKASFYIEKALKELGFYSNLELTNFEDKNHYSKTPIRIAKAWKEFIDNIISDTEVKQKANVTIFNDSSIDELISIVNIPFSSLCIHHFFPFSGFIDIAYIPNGKILGLSKFPRIIKIKCAKPTIQETLSVEIANLFYNLLAPKFVMVVVTAIHSCCSCRGVNTEAPMVYSSIRHNKEFISDKEVNGVKMEALSLFKSARRIIKR